MNMTGGVLLREAGSALHATFRRDDREWTDLTFPEQGWWGMHAAPGVLSTLVITQPEGWMDLMASIQAMTSAWARAGVLDLPNQITGVQS